MGQTPIYDQLRGERINADVPPAGADPQLVGHPGENPGLAVAPVPAAVFGPGPATDLGANRHHLVPTSPASQPAADGQRAVAVWGPRAGCSLAGHAQQVPAHAASSSPALPGSSRHFAARGAAADEHGAHRRQGGGPGRVQRSEPRLATPAGAQFRWFEVDHDTGDSSPYEDEAAHVYPSGQAPAASETELGLSIRFPLLVVFLPLGSWWIPDRSDRRVHGVEMSGRDTGPRREVRSA